MAFNWDDHVQHAKATDIGMRRSNNQDSLAVVMASDMETWRERGHLFMVADGMGAHAAGELASELAGLGVSLTIAYLAAKLCERWMRRTG